MSVYYLIAYGLLVVGTIILLYHGEQKSYVPAKMVTSAAFLWAGVCAPEAVLKSPAGLLFVVGLVFCFFGDLFLALAHEIDDVLINKFFAPGVISFLLAHLCFVGGIYLVMGKPPVLLIFAALAGCATMVVNAINGHSPNFDFQGNFALCEVYAFFVGALLGAGLYVGAYLVGLAQGNLDLDIWVRLGEDGIAHGLTLVAVGSILFLLSDLILSNKLFLRRKNKFFPALVLLLYFPATLCLALFLHSGILG